MINTTTGPISGERDALPRRSAGGRWVIRQEPVYRRRRAVVVALVLLLAYGAWLLAGFVGGQLQPAAAGAASSEPAAAPVVHVVQPGDTLWSIALSLAEAGDVREVVDRLADNNGGAALQVGQRLVIEP